MLKKNIYLLIFLLLTANILSAAGTCTKEEKALLLLKIEEISGSLAIREKKILALEQRLLKAQELLKQTEYKLADNAKELAGYKDWTNKNCHVKDLKKETPEKPQARQVITSLAIEEEKITPFREEHKALPKLPSKIPDIKHVKFTFGDIIEYNVQKGDTIRTISHKFYGTAKYWEQIVTLNKETIEDPNLIDVGMVFKVAMPIFEVPEGSPGQSYSAQNIQKETDEYIVQRGDTLGTISEKFYGTPKYWKQIANLNPETLEDLNFLKEGMILKVSLPNVERKIASE